MRTMFTTCISHPLSSSFSLYSQYARHYGHAVYTPFLAPRRYLYLQHMRVCVSTRTCLRTLRSYSGRRKFMRVSLSACFRRSELLGCMTLPLPLSQDKVNIMKLRVYLSIYSRCSIERRPFSIRFKCTLYIQASTKVCCCINSRSVSEKFLAINY